MLYINMNKHEYGLKRYRTRLTKLLSTESRDDQQQSLVTRNQHDTDARNQIDSE